MTEFQLLQLLVAALGGGAAGSLINVLYNVIKDKIQSNAIENSVFTALKGELQRNILICDYNEKQGSLSFPPFVHLRTETISMIATQNSYRYKILNNLRNELEWYFLSLAHFNELIDDYRLLIPLTERRGPNERDALRNSIVSICQGNKIEGIGPNGFIVLPNFMKALSAKLKDL